MMGLQRCAESATHVTSGACAGSPSSRCAPPQDRRIRRPLTARKPHRPHRCAPSRNSSARALGHAARSVPNVFTSNALRGHPRRPARPRKLPTTIPRSHRPRSPRRPPNLPTRRPAPSRSTLYLRLPRLETLVARRRGHRVHGCARLKTASGGRLRARAVNQISAARRAHTRQTNEQSAVRTTYVFNWKSAYTQFTFMDSANTRPLGRVGMVWCSFG